MEAEFRFSALEKNYLRFSLKKNSQKNFFLDFNSILILEIKSQNSASIKL